MREHVRELAAQAENAVVRTYYNAAEVTDVQGRDYDGAGLLSTEWACSAPSGLRKTRHGQRRSIIYSGLARSCGPLWAA